MYHITCKSANSIFICSVCIAYCTLYCLVILILQMATLQWVERTCTVTPEMIKLAIDSLEDSSQRVKQYFM